MAVRAWRSESAFRLIDVGLLVELRLPGALQGILIELPVPPHAAALALFLDDMGVLLEQVAHHPGQVGFVIFRHGRHLPGELQCRDYTGHGRTAATPAGHGPERAQERRKTALAFLDITV